MKRKLDENNSPSPAPSPAADAQPELKTASFTDFGLDARLLQAIAALKFREPTLVQREAIPLALDGRDVVAKAKTGSGKTAAYVLPVVQSVLKRKQTDPSTSTSALILVPTRELADQVHKAVQSFAAFCAKDVQSIKLTDKVSAAVQRSLLANAPDIVVSTPARAWTNIASAAFNLDKLTHLVLDEADLLLSYGYEEDLQNVAKAMPKGVQTILMSATLTAEVNSLKGLFCRNPAFLDLEEAEAEGDGVSQFVVKCAEDEKFLLIYVIYKLRLIKGKSIIFVADVDRCYRLKLFFEQFGIRSCILNSELPVNSRIHVVEEFNKNVYDIIIASDENEVLGDEDADVEEAEEDEDDSKLKTKARKANGKEQEERPKKKRKSSRGDKEYGISRGIDFKNVAAIINFDLPRSAKSYTHRIGRTGRAGQTGMALSFVIPKEQFRKHVPTSVESTEKDEKVLARIVKNQAKKGKEVQPYHFDMKQVDAFRYRMNDALRAVTRVAVREARTRELRQELLKSEKLKRHFEENPAELHHLRHDGELRAARTQDHLKHVPRYLLPQNGGNAVLGEQEEGKSRKRFVPKFKQNGRNQGKSGSGRPFKAGKKKADPLKSFKVRRKTK